MYYKGASCLILSEWQELEQEAQEGKFLRRGQTGRGCGGAWPGTLGVQGVKSRSGQDEYQNKSQRSCHSSKAYVSRSAGKAEGGLVRG